MAEQRKGQFSAGSGWAALAKQEEVKRVRYPKCLPQGGVIGFLAPSFGCSIEPYFSAFKNAVEKFERMGYKVLLGPNCYAREGVGISNTPGKCGQEVMEMFLSQADCLISCGGGELMCEILPYVDFDRLSEAAPKWFMGYSDNTNLTFLLAILTDTASIYGPCAAAFGMEPWHKALHDTFHVLTGQAAEEAGGTEGKCRCEQTKGNTAMSVAEGYDLWEKEPLKSPENPLASYHVTEPVILRSFLGRRQIFEPVRFRGRLLGGCMDCLVNLVGTRFDRTAEFAERYREDGIIWFLEACDLNVFSTRRAMWQMEEAGWFGHVKGFLIGRPRNGEPMMNLDAYEAVLEVAGRKNVPVIMDVDLGHLPPMMPLVTGSMADVTVQENDIAIAMDFR